MLFVNCIKFYSWSFDFYIFFYFFCSLEFDYYINFGLILLILFILFEIFYEIDIFLISLSFNFFISQIWFLFFYCYLFI